MAGKKISAVLRCMIFYTPYEAGCKAPTAIRVNLRESSSDKQLPVPSALNACAFTLLNKIPGSLSRTRAEANHSYYIIAQNYDLSRDILPPAKSFYNF